MNRVLLAFFFLLFSLNSYAHQPVMDMAPRWEDGFGVQTRYESYGSNNLKNGNSDIVNPLGLKRYVRKSWLEGVYTFKPEYRITFKLPYIEQSRVKNINGVGVAQKNSGFGDLILSLPLKRYINKGAYTSNFGFTPVIRLPTGNSSGNFPISDGSWDAGLSVSYAYEGFPFNTKNHFKIYQLYDLSYWYNTTGHNGMREGHEVGLDINIGIQPLHNEETNSGMFLLWDITARYNGKPSAENLTTANYGRRLHTGPIVIFYKENIMFRAEYKFPAYENVKGMTNSRGNEINIGIGITF